MHNKFISYINSQLSIQLSDEEIQIINDVFIPKKIRKNQFLLQEGEVSKNATFIISGAFKQYTIDDSGKENILNLFIENSWVGDRESFINEIPSPFFIEATEVSEILVCKKEDFIAKLEKKEFMSNLVKLLFERNALRLLKRLHANKTMTAEQRITDFENNYPDFIQRFPQHIIASYLGMTKETLSRIRSNSIKK